jgi:guanylate kinase
MSAEKRTQGRVIVLSGPSGAGKTTLHDLLLKAPEFRRSIVRSISATTRAPRGKEKHGQEYLFFSKKMFEHKIRSGQFLEWANVFGNYYGTPLKNVRDILRSGKNVLLCIDVQGGQEVKKKIPQALLIFVKTPSLKELQERLIRRGTDAKESVALRLKTAAKELTKAKHYQYVLVNDTLARAYGELEAVLKKELSSLSRR